MTKRSEEIEVIVQDGKEMTPEQFSELIRILASMLIAELEGREDQKKLGNGSETD